VALVKREAIIADVVAAIAQRSGLAHLISRPFARMALTANTLQPSGTEGIPVTLVRFDVIRDRGPDDEASSQAEGAQRLGS
jgi:hypothetical protein